MKTLFSAGLENFKIVDLLGNNASRRFLLAFGVVYALVWGSRDSSCSEVAQRATCSAFVHFNQLDNFLHSGLGAAIASGELICT